MAASLNRSVGAAAGPQRYWAPCLAVALLAMFLFYVTLQDLVRESAARAPVAVAVMPARVEARSPPAIEDNTLETRVRPARIVRASMPVVADVAPQPEVARKTRMVEVSKCVTPSGELEYSDGPCQDGAVQATKLRLSQN